VVDDQLLYAVRCFRRYVKTYLLPDKTKNGKRKTRVKKHTLHPIFDEVLKVSDRVSHHVIVVRNYPILISQHACYNENTYYVCVSVLWFIFF